MSKRWRKSPPKQKCLLVYSTSHSCSLKRFPWFSNKKHSQNGIWAKTASWIGKTAFCVTNHISDLFRWTYCPTVFVQEALTTFSSVKSNSHAFNCPNISWNFFTKSATHRKSIHLVHDTETLPNPMLYETNAHAQFDTTIAVLIQNQHDLSPHML